ncbi:MAG: IS1380 family transposase [Candidatus Rokubacteria bacterium]|nr:IS1380 family transposase [Candidatus Rokubacteria bacterium]
MKRTSRRPSLVVTTGGKGVVAHAGARLLCDLADRLGLSEGLSAALAPTKRRRRGHDRGRVAVDLAVALADGATAISDLRALAGQPALFGDVASVSTAWRTLDAIDDAALGRIATARAQARRRAWAAGMDPGFYVIDIDGTLVNSHSDKEQAAPTYKGGFGFYPLVAYLDRTGEPLAALLRPGNAGSGTAADHITVLDAALFQLPIDPRTREVIVRTDSAAASHEFLTACRERGCRFVVGHALTADIAKVVVQAPASRWIPALSADGMEEREGAEVAEITESVDLSGWPKGTRMIARREVPHEGAQLTFTDIDGHRYQVFLTDHPGRDVAFFEALYRGRGRAECAIRDAKDTGLANLPSGELKINQAWLALVLVAGDLLAWTKGLCLRGELARAEPKRLRFALLHAAGVIVRSARRLILRIAAGWPWAGELVAAFGRLPSSSLVT